MLCTIDTENLPCFLGNDNLHAITAQKKYTLRVDLADFEGETSYAHYTDFAVANEGNKYKLTLGSYSGTAGDYDFALLCSRACESHILLININQVCGFAQRKDSVLLCLPHSDASRQS